VSTKVEIRHVFPCPEDTFWEEIFDNAEFDTELFVETLKFPAYEVLNRTVDDDGVMKRDVRTVPASDAPAVVKKALGDNVSYIEHGTYDPKKRRYRFDIEPNRLRNKIDITGEMWSEPIGDGDEMHRCVRIEVSVKIFGVGRIVESFIADSMRDNYEKAAAFTTEWLEKKS